MPETTSTTRFSRRQAHPSLLIERWLSVCAAAPQSSRRERGGINARRSGGAAPRQCQWLELQRHRLRKWRLRRARATPGRPAQWKIPGTRAPLPVSPAFVLSLGSASA